MLFVLYKKTLATQHRKSTTLQFKRKKERKEGRKKERKKERKEGRKEGRKKTSADIHCTRQAAESMECLPLSA